MRTLLLLLLTVSCSHFSERECFKSQVKRQGFQDGTVDKYNFDHYEAECRAHNIKISKPSYQKGFALGLEAYCTYHLAYQHALKDVPPSKACMTFSPAYQKGQAAGAKEREKEKVELRKAAIADLVERHGTLECHSNFQCRKHGKCTAGTCEHNDKACHYNSDCEVEGVCRPIDAWISEISEKVAVTVCEF